MVFLGVWRAVARTLGAGRLTAEGSASIAPAELVLFADGSPQRR